MSTVLQAPLAIVGRLMLATIFLMSAVGNKIPKFDQTVSYMTQAGVPYAPLMLVGAIVFLLVGSISVILGFRARVGAGLLLVFLTLATYFFHPFWKDPSQMIDFMKNLSMAGAMVLIVAAGSGPGSLDGRRRTSAA